MSIMSWVADVWKQLAPERPLGESLEIIAEDDDLVVLVSRNRALEANRRTRVLRYRDGQLLASFDNIHSFEITRFSRGSEVEEDWWALTMHLKNRKRVDIGASKDNVDVSIAAARLATITGTQAQHQRVRFPM
jgi:hypothetical protein